MDATLVIGWIAAFVGTVLGLPQLVRLLRTRDVAGVALPAWQVTLAINVAWLVHGVRVAQLNMVVVNVFGLLSTVTILILLARALPLPLAKVLVPGLAMAATMIAVDVWLGGAIYGLVAAVPAVAGQLTQSVELLRAERVQGVSTLFLALATVNFALWTAWAFLAGDTAAFIASFATGAAAAFNLAWLLLRRSGVGPVPLSRRRVAC